MNGGELTVMRLGDDETTKERREGGDFDGRAAGRRLGDGGDGSDDEATEGQRISLKFLDRSAMTPIHAMGAVDALVVRA